MQKQCFWWWGREYLPMSTQSQKASSYPLEKNSGHEQVTGTETPVCLLLKAGFILNVFEDQTSKLCQPFQMTTKKILLVFCCSLLLWILRLSKAPALVLLLVHNDTQKISFSSV